MPAVHRQDDGRSCGATTNVAGQSKVYANNKLVSVHGDPNTHGGGGLIAGSKNVYINNLLVVNHTPDQANPDSICPIPPHCNPETAGGSPDVFVGD